MRSINNLIYSLINFFFCYPCISGHQA